MALSAAERDRLCCETINTFLFDRVWNEPVSEFRVNIKPILLMKRSSVGSFPVSDGNIFLPTPGDSYFLWAISSENFNLGLTLESGKWYDTATICNEWRTLIHMYGPAGELFSKGCVYLQFNESRSTIFVAAMKSMVAATMDLSMMSGVYITVYYDSDMPNDVHILSMNFKQSYREAQAQQAIDEFISQCKNKDQLQYFINGREVTPITAFPVLEKGDYLDIVFDENIEFAFDIDIYADSENPVFLSERDKTWKQLIHIPKNLNPDNKVITHNTCDLYIRKKDDPIQTGLYVHRAAGRRSVNQVTHNDMAVPLFIIDAYRDALQTEDVTIHVVVRIHDKDNYLIRDYNYIDLLYTHTDQEIIDILVGKKKLEKIKFWSAQVLESSKYIEMMFDVPEVLTVNNMPEYVKALGFYQIVNLLCRRIVDVTLTDAFKGSLTFSLPVLYSGMNVTPIVYLNKRVISMTYIRYFIDHTENTCTIHIHNEIPVKPGDKLSVIFFVDGDSTVIRFTPSATKFTLDVPYQDANIYRKKTVYGKTWKGLNTESHHSYELLKPGTNAYVTKKTDTGMQISMHSSYLGEELLIQSAYCSYRKTIDLRPWTSTGKTLAIPVETFIDNDKDNVPILNFKNVNVYLNGNYMVRDVDYFINTVTDDEGNISFKELVIQTMDHFNENGTDRLDVLFNVAEIEDISSGFTIENQLRDETPVNLYFENISTAHVNGQLERYADYRGVYIQLPENTYQQGDIFEIQTSVPKVVKDFIEQFTTNEDKERIVILNEYFYGFRKIVPDVLLLERKHRIYSTFMNNFINAVRTGELALLDEPDINRMKEQIKPFLYMKDMDICFSNIDRRFVDFYPQYVNYEVTPHMKYMLDKFIEFFMAKNTDPTVEVVTNG